MVSTKIDLNHNRIARLEDLDELAAVLFPGNKNHQRIFLAVYVELKWSEDQFLPSLEPIADKHGLSRRVLETVRAKMRRLGIIEHVSRFNKKHGYREGWVFSNRFQRSIMLLAALESALREKKKPKQEKQDRYLLQYL